VIVGGALAAVLPFVVARVQAWHSIPAIVHAIVSRPPQAPLAVRLLIAVAVAVPAALVLRVVVPDRRGLRAAATPTAIALGAVAGHLTAAGAYSQRLAWPIAIAFGIILVIELARSAWSGPTAPVTMLVLGLLIYEGREARGRLRLSRRIPALMHGIDALRHPPGRGADPYREVLASVPAGATVAVWVAEPERLDYARHRIVDLRTPMAGRLRVQRWGAHASKLDQVLAALQASFLLVEGDDAQVQRTQTDLLYRLVCATPKPGCADDLEAIALTHRIAAHRDNLQLVDLRP
jgi:hypothetical protein